ncbi:hypothetical protein L3Q65_00275 (plasmid) [Amycolatopsis sp. FU40]|uniref:hypothetical protein n=1 Tax=Amycolatopsis sp. FU40 TaxID=2914159 RepID=UPI001F3F08D1|nr:hypothetical protein [Amycolatopsis sp. FU40]UKD50735.1 hypothetical protein L3Q65_00275 [Amycolatopsis sp. FU40]
MTEPAVPPELDQLLAFMREHEEKLSQPAEREELNRQAQPILEQLDWALRQQYEADERGKAAFFAALDGDEDEPRQ